MFQIPKVPLKKTSLSKFQNRVVSIRTIFVYSSTYCAVNVGAKKNTIYYYSIYIFAMQMESKIEPKINLDPLF